MRAREKIKSPRDFERFLKRHGFTAKEAKTVVSYAWSHIKKSGDGEKAKECVLFEW